MIWDRSNTIAMADLACVHCHGYGLRPGKAKRETVCGCVLRGIFRACYARFIVCEVYARNVGTWVRGEHCKGRDRHLMYGRKAEEFRADFCLMARRVLDELEHDVFRLHFLAERDCVYCCGRLHIDRGKFFHTVYLVQEKAGRAFAEVEPFGLFPMDEYFGGTTDRLRPSLCLPVLRSQPCAIPLRPPVTIRRQEEAAYAAA